MILLAGILLISNWSVSGRTEKVHAAGSENFANVIVCAYFEGDTDGPAYFEQNTKALMDLYDGTDTCTFTKYLNHISYGNLRLKNYFPQYDGTKIVPVKLSMTEQTVLNSGNMDETILPEVMKKLKSVTGKLDYNESGVIDNVTVILRAQDGTASSANSLVSHHQTYGGNLKYQNLEVRDYNMINTKVIFGSSSTDINAQGSGVLVHEFLHTFNFPDLYTNNGTVPVGTWDIMGGVTSTPSYPLAYMRMRFGKWLSLDTITTAQTLTLDTQDKNTGCQAYILKSPLNESEFFVVEFRKKAETNDMDSYDRAIGGSGVIVYRINPSVEDLSNMHGGTGVYVFRSQPGSKDYNVYNENVSNAFLSKESGRTTIGKSDLSAGLSDGALTFSDGTNSGIVISEVGSAEGSQITLKVDFPKVEASEKWENLEFPATSYEIWDVLNDQIAMTMVGNVPYVLTYTQKDNAISLYSYQNQTWTKKFTEALTESFVDSIRICEYGGSIYYAYQGTTGINIRKLNSARTGIAERQTIPTTNYSFDMKAGADGIYVVYIYGDKTAYMKKYLAGGLSTQADCGSYYTAAISLGQPQITVAGTILYASVRDSNGNQIRTFRMDKPGAYTEIGDADAAGSAYVTATDGTNLYIVTNQNGITVWRYDKASWTTAQMQSTNISDMAAVCKQGTLFVLAAKDTNTNLYRYDVTTNQFAQEGVSLDSNSGSQTICTENGNLYMAYRRQSDSKLVVKKKTVTVTPAPEPTPDPDSGTDPDPGTDPKPGTGETTTTTEAAATTTEAPTPTPTSVVTPDVTVAYRTHIQTFGWENVWRQNGAMSGTSGLAKRLEGIEIKVSGNSSLRIQYTTHCQSYGWLPWSANGGMNGTQGEAKRLEAIKIQLTGADKNKYDVYYRVHAQSYGWLGWAKNGAPAGTAGYAKRLEGIQIVVVKRGQTFNAKMENIISAYPLGYYAKAGTSPVVNAKNTSNVNPQIAGADSPNVTYRTHVQSYGWQGWKYNGQMSGTSGRAKRLERIEIKLTNAPYSGGICYTTHVQSYGWQEPTNNPSAWRRNGTMSGTSGQAKRLEAICISLTGDMQQYYDVYYRVHAQTFGWLDWAKNGAPAGTAGYAKRLEGIEIRLVPKGQAAPGRTARSYIAK